MKQHCENCNCNKEEWVRLSATTEIQSVATPIKSAEDIKIPPGLRLLTFSDIALAIEKNIIPLDETWIEYCVWKTEVRAVWVDIYTGRFYLYCNYIPINYLGRSRWVRFVRDLKK